MENEVEEGSEPEEDYYTFLNIAKDATQDEITSAYRRLSKLYHPDKHVDPVRKKEAEIMFNKMKKAYEVLKDEHKRAIYDSVGEKGLKTEGWEIIERTTTPQDIREEYERIARQREERRLQQRTNPKANITVNINATELFTSYDYDYDYEESILPVIEVSGMTVNISTESPLTGRDTATLSAQMGTHNGTGSGHVNLSNRRTVSEKGWFEVTTGAGSGALLGIKGFRTLTKRLFINGDTHLHFTSSGVRTNFESTLGLQLDTRMMGYLSYRGGSNSSMSTTIVRDSDNGHFSLTLLLGVPHSFVTASYVWKFKERELRIRTAVKFGTFGSMLEYGAEKKISEQSTVAATVSLGIPTGVILKLKFTRACQTYNFPIHLCEEICPSPVFYATVVPLISFLVVKKLVIDPIVTEREESKKQRQRENYKNRLSEKRREAEAAINLMRVAFSRVRSEEENRRGLVIVNAKYGKLSCLRGGNTDEEPNRNVGSPEDVIDVTIPLQCLVQDSKLVIHSTSKSGLAGFYDPCPGEEKGLFVQYLLRNQLHETTVLDKEYLRIPRQSHRVMTT